MQGRWEFDMVQEMIQNFFPPMLPQFSSRSSRKNDFEVVSGIFILVWILWKISYESFILKACFRMKSFTIYLI